jgi:integrase
LTLTFTGRRRAEVMGLKAGNLLFDGEAVQYTYRGKGGKTGKRELPGPAYEGIVKSLEAWGKALETMAPAESLWPSASNPQGLTSGTFYGNLRRCLRKAGLPLAGVHVFRHIAARLRRDVWESAQGFLQQIRDLPFPRSTRCEEPPSSGRVAQGAQHGRPCIPLHSAEILLMYS